MTSEDELLELETAAIQSIDGELRGPALKAVARIRDQDTVIAELVEALESVMTWIDNWGPNFSEDEEWTQEDIKIGNLIAKHKAGE